MQRILVFHTTNTDHEHPYEIHILNVALRMTGESIIKTTGETIADGDQKGKFIKL